MVFQGVTECALDSPAVPPTAPLAHLQWPHEAPGIRRFYNACWEVFDALNAIELKSLEEPRYLLEQFVKEPFHW